MTRQINFVEGSSRFKGNHLGLALGMVLHINISVGKGLQLKAKRFLGVIPMFIAVTVKKLVGRIFALQSFYNKLLLTQEPEFV